MEVGEVWIKEAYTDGYGKEFDRKIYIVNEKTKSKAGKEMFIVTVIAGGQKSTGVFTEDGIPEFTKPDRNHIIPADEAAKYILESL